MTETNLSDHPLEVVDMKGSVKNKGRGDRYSFYLVESVIRACDELYQYCLINMDSTLCHEMVIFLQSIAYDFVALNEWLKLKAVCKDLPPPIRTSVSPTRVSRHLKKMSRSRSFRRAKSEPGLDKAHLTYKEEKIKNAPKTAGVNVSAPDFVPAQTSEHDVETSWNYSLSESERNSFNNPTIQSHIDTKTGIHNQFCSHSSMGYSEEERHLNASLVNLSYTQNVLPPNFWQYSTHINLNPFQHPTLQVPHHYIPHVPHIHLPYSLYTNTLGAGNMYPIGPLGNVVAEQMQCSINSGINHSFIYSTSETSLQPLDIVKNEREERPSSSLSDSSDIVVICNKNDVSNSDRNENNEGLNCEKDTSQRKEPEDDTLPLLASDLTEKSYGVNEGIDVREHEETSEVISRDKLENITSNTEPMPPDKIINETSIIVDPQIPEQIIASQSKVILGLREDECLIHFPELKPNYSHSKQKFRHKTTVKINNIKPSCEITCSVNTLKVLNNKPNSKSHFENSNEEKSSFSKLFKSPSTLEKQPVRPFFNTNKRKVKNTNSQLPSFSLKQSSTKAPKESIDKINTPISSYINDENNDSDGWETVKIRSKWRDQTEFKQSRNGVRNNGKLYDSRNLQCFNNNKSNEFGATIACNPESIIKPSGSDEESVLSKPIDDKTFKAKQKNILGGNLIEKNLDSEKYAKKGRRNSNYAQKINGNEEYKQNENLSLGDKTEKIDPNEMYSAYMQYINNVDEENQDSQTKNDKSILHPDAGEEIPQSVASLEEMTDFVNRDPIRALEFKRKLADEIKHQEDVKRRNEVKQQQAQKKRLQFLQCKTAKVREFVQKVEEVKAAQHQLALQRKSRIDLKLKKAEENRNMHLNIIKRKAHDEEEKLKEIAFINELEAQNRRHDSLALRQEHEERLQCLVEERQRRLEEKAAREAAVEERRRVLEAERQEKLEKMKEKRRRKQEIIDRKQQEREQERLEIAREKAREREERLQARQSAQLATVEELQKRIQQKQEESARRHVECIELIRQKAVEIGLHRNTFENVANCINVYKPDEQLKCEISLKDHPDFQKINKLNQKKRFKKIKSRMTVKGNMFIESVDSSENGFSAKDLQLEKLLEKFKAFSPHDIYLWQDEECLSVDHYLNEMIAMLRTNPTLQNSFKQLKGYILMNSIIHSFNHCDHERLSICSLKCIIKIVNLCQVTCTDNLENCQYIVLSNIIVTLLETLKLSIKILGSSSKSWETLAEILLMLCSNTMEGVNLMNGDQIIQISDFSLRMKDLISYIMFSGIMNTVVYTFRASEIDEKFTHTSLIIPCISFFSTLLSTKFKTEELMNMLKTTDLFGTVPFLYEGLMQHLTKDGSLPDYSLPIVTLFLKLADLDLKAFQDILGSEGIALQWRGIASGLMMLCVRKKYFGELLHSVIKTVGYFAVNNKKNQTLIQSGKHPTVLQQLVKLPFQYFCDPRHMELLFPTLIACSYQNATNRAIVESELNYSVLENFISSDIGKRNKLMLLLENQNGSVEVS